MAEGNPWEDQLIADVRANGGRPSDGPLKGHPIGIMWTTGAKSGEQRRSIVTVSKDGGDYVIAGTNGGNSDKHPAWIANIQADPHVKFEADGNGAIEATAEEVEGPERDRLWANHVAQLPWFGKYEEQITGRSIPVVRVRKAG
jgi:deazaflavin-dependent oxidoreductase (nitroreductase family)